MSTEYNFKKISDVDVIESVNDSAHVIIEEAGVLKKMAANSIGAVKTVNGAAPDADGNVQIEVSAGGAGGVSSWNDLTDKPFGDEITVTKKYVDNFTVEIAEETEAPPLLPYFPITAGKVYDVTVNGVDYECKAFIFEGIPVIGNASIMGMPDTGEPLLIADLTAIYGEEFVMVMPLQNGTFTISVSNTSTEVTKLDPQYISTHGVDTCNVNLLDQSVKFYVSEGNYVWCKDSQISSEFLQVDGVYNVTWDGVEYENLTCYDEFGYATIGVTYDDHVDAGVNGDFPFHIESNCSQADGDEISYIDIATADPGAKHNIKIVNATSGVTIFDQVVEFDVEPVWQDDDEGDLIATEVLQLGATYDVIWDGVEYKNLECFADYGYPIIGASEDALYDGTNSLPFCIGQIMWVLEEYGVSALYIGTTDIGTEHTVKITKTSNIRQLDEKFIPDTIARAEDVTWANLKGKPFYDTTYSTETIFEGTVKAWMQQSDENFYSSSYSDYIPAGRNMLKPGHEYEVKIDGQFYGAYCYTDEDSNTFIGSSYDEVISGEGSLPFYISCYFDSSYNECEFHFVFAEQFDTEYKEHEIEISCNGCVYPIDEKYIPDTIARTASLDYMADWLLDEVRNNGAGLPEVTAETEGAFLRIVNGVPTWVVMENAEDGEY